MELRKKNLEKGDSQSVTQKMNTILNQGILHTI